MDTLSTIALAFILIPFASVFLVVWAAATFPFQQNSQHDSICGECKDTIHFQEVATEIDGVKYHSYCAAQGRYYV